MTLSVGDEAPGFEVNIDGDGKFSLEGAKGSNIFIGSGGWLLCLAPYIREAPPLDGSRPSSVHICSLFGFGWWICDAMRCAGA